MTLTDDLHSHQTEFFIAENPTVVTCLRSAHTSTGTGGFVLGAEVDSGERTVRLVGLSNTPSPRTTASGQVVVPEGVAIAMPDDDWLVGDRFVAGGKKFEVVFVSSSPPWRKRLETITHG